MAQTKLYIYLILANSFVTVSFTAPKMNYKQCLGKDKMITAIAAISCEKCLHECLMRIGCLSLNYRRQHLLCELFSTNAGTFVTNNGQTGPCVHIARSDIAVPKYSSDCACTNLQTCFPESGACASRECTNFEFPNVVLRGNMKKVGARVSVKCVSELFKEETGRTSIQCQPNGTWNHEPNCVSQYIGCYKDNGRRILMSENVLTDRKMTIELCINNCLQYTFAEMQSGTQCFCGNTLDEHLKDLEGNCNRRCAGNNAQICGGTWRGSVYKIK